MYLDNTDSSLFLERRQAMPKKVIFITVTVIIVAVIALSLWERSLCSVEIGGLGLTFKAQLAYES